MAVQPPRWLWNLDQLVERATTTTPTTHLIDTAIKKVAAIFRPLPGREIAEVGVLCTAVVGTPPALEARLESVVAALPSGTLLAPTARGVFTPQAANWHWIRLEASHAPADPLIAVVIGWSSGTVGTANSATLSLRAGGAFAASNLCPLSHSGTAWTTHAGNVPVIAIRYRDGTLHPGLPPLRSVTTLILGTTTTPTEVGNRFQVDAGLTIDALGAVVRLPSGSGAQLTLYRPDGSTLVAPPPLLAGRDLVSTSNQGMTVLPVADTRLSRFETVLLGLRGTMATGCQTVKLSFVDAAARESAVGRTWWVQRTGTGAWQEDLAAVAALVPRVIAYDTTGGWRRHPGLTGGLPG